MKERGKEAIKKSLHSMKIICIQKEYINIQGSTHSEIYANFVMVKCILIHIRLIKSNIATKSNVAMFS